MNAEPAAAPRFRWVRIVLLILVAIVSAPILLAIFIARLTGGR